MQLYDSGVLCVLHFVWHAAQAQQHCSSHLVTNLQLECAATESTCRLLIARFKPFDTKYLCSRRDGQPRLGSLLSWFGRERRSGAAEG